MKNLRVSMFTAIFIIVSTFDIFAAPVTLNAYTNINTNGIYKIVNRNGKVVDVQSNSTANGAVIQLWESVPSVRNQMFRFESKGNETYAIRAIHSGKTLEVRNSSKEARGTISQWDFNNIPTMKWKIFKPSSGDKNIDNFLYIRNENSGMFMDVDNNGKSNGTRIFQYPGNLTDAQKFSLQRVDSSVGLYTNWTGEKTFRVKTTKANAKLHIGTGAKNSVLITLTDLTTYKTGSAYAKNDAKIVLSEKNREYLVTIELKSNTSSAAYNWSIKKYEDCFNNIY